MGSWIFTQENLEILRTGFGRIIIRYISNYNCHEKYTKVAADGT